eukprot:COSAG01_NODE_3299_length_6296_cov_243.565112_5_plen_236_part_00
MSLSKSSRSNIISFRAGGVWGGGGNEGLDGSCSCSCCCCCSAGGCLRAAPYRFRCFFLLLEGWRRAAAALLRRLARSVRLSGARSVCGGMADGDGVTVTTAPKACQHDSGGEAHPRCGKAVGAIMQCSVAPSRCKVHGRCEHRSSSRVGGCCWIGSCVSKSEISYTTVEDSFCYSRDKPMLLLLLPACCCLLLPDLIVRSLLSALPALLHGPALAHSHVCCASCAVSVLAVWASY